MRYSMFTVVSAACAALFPFSFLYADTPAGGYSRLRVDTDPQGANVAIIADLGKTPLINDYLTPGQYRLEIRHPDGKYLTDTLDVTFAGGQPLNISRTLEKPKIFTAKRIAQSALGAGAALCFTWAVAEQSTKSYYQIKHRELQLKEDHEGAAVPRERFQNADLRRTIAIVAAATLSVTLQVSIFLW